VSEVLGGAQRCSKEAIAIKQFMRLWPIYQGTVPGDLQDMIDRREHDPSLYTSFPVLSLVGALLKYGPARDAMDVAARMHVVPDGDVTVHNLYALLEHTARNLDNVDMQVWSTNCGKGVSFHSGFAPWLGRLGLIKKVEGLPRRGSTVALGQQGLLYSVQPLGGKLEERLSAVVDAGAVIRAVQLRPPLP